MGIKIKNWFQKYILEIPFKLYILNFFKLSVKFVIGVVFLIFCLVVSMLLISISSSNYPYLETWILQLKLLPSIWDSIQGFIKYMLTPIITIVIAYNLYKQWQYDKFVEIQDRIIKAEGKYIKEIDELKDKEYKEYKEDKEEYDRLKDNIIISFLDNLEILAIAVEKRSICHKTAENYFGYFILKLYDPKFHTVLAEYLNKKDQKRYTLLDNLHKKYKK